MIVDSSALVAMLRREDLTPMIEDVLIDHRSRMSAPTLVEVRAVVGSRFGEAGLHRLQAMLRRFGTEIIAFDADQADVASAAYRRFGRGSQHAANLNFGDTFSYALAVVRDEPLLYVGDDFSHTDIRSALEEYAP